MRYCLLLALALLPAGAQALMPPHFNSTEPAAGAELTSRVILLRGYSLGYAKAKLIDEAGAEVPHSVEVDCKTEGEPGPPGSQQQRCVMTLTLTGELKPGAQVTVSLLGDEVSFKVPVGGLPELKAPVQPASAPVSPTSAAPKSAGPKDE